MKKQSWLNETESLIATCYRGVQRDGDVIDRLKMAPRSCWDNYVVFCWIVLRLKPVQPSCEYSWSSRCQTLMTVTWQVVVGIVSLGAKPGQPKLQYSRCMASQVHTQAATEKLGRIYCKYTLRLFLELSKIVFQCVVSSVTGGYCHDQWHTLPGTVMTHSHSSRVWLPGQMVCYFDYPKCKLLLQKLVYSGISW